MAASGAGAASSRGWWGVDVLLLVDPVWLVRREWEVVENGFPNTDAPRCGVVGVLELA